MTSRSHILMGAWFRGGAEVPGLDVPVRPVDATTYELLRMIKHPLFASVSAGEVAKPGPEASEEEVEAWLSARDLEQLALVGDYLWVQTASDEAIEAAFLASDPAAFVRSAARAARFPLAALDAAQQHISESIAEINAALTEPVPDGKKKTGMP